MGSIGSEPVELDALVVGAGFGGVYQLKKLRDRGFNVKLVERGTDFGGVWYWNRYPGARVDSTIPFYEFSDPGLWTDWTWKQRFPGSAEIREYFKYMAEKWDLRRDAIFDTLVVSAVWNETDARWIIKTEHGLVFKARFFLPNTGIAARRHVPDWKGIDSFAGTFLHPSYWPKVEPDLKGKRVAVIGTGSTGIQLVQDIAPLASEFVLFQRTPNLCMPMKQVNYVGKEQAWPKERYTALFDGRKDSFGGFDYNFLPKATFDVSDEERRQTYQSLWEEGDFKFWLATYYDMMFSDRANTEAYNFWRDKVRARINNPKLQEKFAPMIKPHAFGCKRISLETTFYEQFNKPHVHLVDVNETPILEVTPRGIKTIEKEWEFDLIVCATGYDAVTGGILDMNIIGKDDVLLRDYWKEGVKTYQGLGVSGFPNMFFTYGPQAPTAFCNGPSCAEMQGEWIVSLLEHMRAHDIQTVDASAASEKEWADNIWTLANASLLPTVDSWYMGSNVPGKRREPLIYLGGVPQYYKILGECAKNGYQGYVLA